jgi:hypothetical protein
MIHKPWSGNFNDIYDKNTKFVEELESFLKSNECPILLKNEVNRTEEAVKNPFKTTQPCTGSDVPEIDPNDPYIDERTREAIDGLSNLRINFDKDDLKNNLDLGINYNWMQRHEYLPSHMNMEEIETFISVHIDLISTNKSEREENDLDIPKFNDGSEYNANNLTHDQKQVYCHSMKTIKAWIEEKQQRIV